MRNKIINLLLTGVFLLSLCACGLTDTTPESTTSNTITDIKTTQKQTTENTTKENSNTEAITESIYKINTDAIADLGLTYSQLTEKHGKLVDAKGIEIGVSYAFKTAMVGILGLTTILIKSLW